MKRIQVYFTLALMLFAGFALSSCKQKKGEIFPSLEFAPYVSAYTGGVISSNSTIRVELAQKQEIIELGAEAKERLFSFSPTLKGKTYWVDNRTLEFIPDSGALKPGMLYNTTFALW